MKNSEEKIGDPADTCAECREIKTQFQKLFTVSEASFLLTCAVQAFIAVQENPKTPPEMLIQARNAIAKMGIGVGANRATHAFSKATDGRTQILFLCTHGDGVEV